jgi:MFS family permease
MYYYMETLFRSLKVKNYRLFFFSQTLSMTGAWLQLTAMPWLIYRLTNSTFLLGAVGFISQIFILVFSLFSGTVADHYDRKKLLIITQALSMLQALVLGVLTLTGRLQLWHIFALATAIGIVNAFDMPARQAFLTEMVGKENLMNAIGLNALLFNSARILGPALAGILIASMGEGMCFVLNGFSFSAVIVALYFIKPIPLAQQNRGQTMSEKFFSGFRYVRGRKKIYSLLLLLSATSLASVFPMTLMPVFVKDIYKMNAAGLGLFMSAMGIGALIATLKVASTKSVDGIQKTIFVSAIAFSVFTIGFAVVHNIYAVLIFLVLAGYFVVLQMGLTNIFVQAIVPDELRGRVMGFYITAFVGLSPFGSLLAGSSAIHLSAPLVVTLGGAGNIVAALLLKNNIYDSCGALPENLETAAVSDE